LFEADCYQSFTLSNQSIADYQTKVLNDVFLIPTSSVVPTNLTASNLTSSSALITWDSSSGNKYDLRYREIGNPDWIDVLNLSSAPYNLSGLTDLTDYEVQVRANCGANSSSYSSSSNFTTLLFQINYCDSTSSNANDEFIGRVQLNTIDNLSGPQLYSDFTGISTTLETNSQYTITITPTWSGRSYREGYGVWIDYNNNGDFSDPGEEILIQSPTRATSVSSSFVVPSNAIEPSVRMRVSMKYNGSPGPCESFTYGEVEDYTINIQGLIDTTAPVITLNGNSIINLNVGDNYNEIGATATDNVDGNITANIVIGGDIVNTNIAGSYIITYNVS
ncbi:GEVED domain-containing protein, partial [Litoribaculum gwangyangense]|uniref:GEVED domain-containing protein n=1 Tax=Litoribaculum gwangyangense TaxID=1130722 RepID=UPI0031E6C45F